MYTCASLLQKFMLGFFVSFFTFALNCFQFTLQCVISEMRNMFMFNLPLLCRDCKHKNSYGTTSLVLLLIVMLFHEEKGILLLKVCSSERLLLLLSNN